MSRVFLDEITSLDFDFQVDETYFIIEGPFRRIVKFAEKRTITERDAGATQVECAIFVEHIPVLNIDIHVYVNVRTPGTLQRRIASTQQADRNNPEFLVGIPDAILDCGVFGFPANTHQIPVDKIAAYLKGGRKKKKTMKKSKKRIYKKNYF
jgi:hypothetical protein